MRNSLDRVMERLYFVYLSLSEKNKFFTDDVFLKWEKNLYIRLDSKFIDRTFKKYIAFKEDESELSSVNAWLEALVLHFSKVNMISFLQDLNSIKTTFSEDRESLNELIGNICSDWEIDFENL